MLWRHVHSQSEITFINGIKQIRIAMSRPLYPYLESLMSSIWLNNGFILILADQSVLYSLRWYKGTVFDVFMFYKALTVRYPEGVVEVVVVIVVAIYYHYHYHYYLHVYMEFKENKTFGQTPSLPLKSYDAPPIFKCLLTIYILIIIMIYQWLFQHGYC